MVLSVKGLSGKQKFRQKEMVNMYNKRSWSTGPDCFGLWSIVFDADYS